MSGKIVWSPKKRIRLNEEARENRQMTPSQASLHNRRDSGDFDAELSAFLPPVSFNTTNFQPEDDEILLSIDLDGPKPQSHNSLSTQEADFDELAGVDVDALFDEVVLEKGGISVRLKVVSGPLEGVPGGIGLELIEVETNKTRYITLTESWMQMFHANPIQPGDLVHLFVPSPGRWQSDHFLISDSTSTYPPPLLIVHPEFIFTGTAVSSTVGCNRKAFLQWLFTLPEERSAAALPALVGSTVHDLVQWGLPLKPSMDELCEKLEKLAVSSRVALWQAAKSDSPDLVSAVVPKLPALHAFLKSADAAALGAFLSAEEEITSQQLGLKGKLDLIVGTEENARCVELKTGKPHVSHIGQVLIYHLLLTEKFGKAQQPQLIYLEEGGARISPTAVTARETVNIMTARNRLAAHAKRVSLPEPLRAESKECSFCNVREQCKILAPFESPDYIKQWWGIIAGEEAADQGPFDIEDAAAKLTTSSTFKRMRGALLQMHTEKSPWLKILQNPLEARQGETVLSTQERSATRQLTAEQVDAVKRGLFAADTSEVLVNVCGFPGTGKSTLLATLATLAALRGKRVLITAHTHSAVDNIISKISQVPVVRLAGRREDVHADCWKYLPPNFDEERVAPFLDGKLIFACTALGAHHPLIDKKFDLLILDEAGQLAECSLWAPLRLCASAVQVGDPMQLPPLMRSAVKLDSFFVKAVNAGCNVIELVAQFRMNMTIMGLANALYYSGKLRCGSEEVAKRKFETTTVDAVWDPLHPLVFISTNDPISVTISLARASGAAVLCPWKKDVAKIKESVEECMTIDKAQGRDWPAVIVLLNATADAQIMKETRRLNVALTRAKSKLVICGDRRECPELVRACESLEALFLDY